MRLHQPTKSPIHVGQLSWAKREIAKSLSHRCALFRLVGIGTISENDLAETWNRRECTSITAPFLRRNSVMKRPIFGMLLGGFLGIFDGLTALISAPETAPEIVGIVIGSTIKGLITGVL